MGIGVRGCCALNAESRITGSCPCGPQQRPRQCWPQRQYACVSATATLHLCNLRTRIPLVFRGAIHGMHACTCRRTISELHHTTANDIGVDPGTREELHRLLNNLQQLLVGISIMQARPRGRPPGHSQLRGCGAAVGRQISQGVQNARSRLLASARQGAAFSWVPSSRKWHSSHACRPVPGHYVSNELQDVSQQSQCTFQITRPWGLWLQHQPPRGALARRSTFGLFHFQNPPRQLLQLVSPDLWTCFEM